MKRTITLYNKLGALSVVQLRLLIVALYCRHNLKFKDIDNAANFRRKGVKKMETLIKGFGLGITLIILALNSGCGKADPTPAVLMPAPIVNVTNTTIIQLYAVPVGDEAGGVKYNFHNHTHVKIPSFLYRTQGVVEQDGRGAGLDFGDAGQCYYTASQSNPGVYTFESCTKALMPDQILERNDGDFVVFWGYIHTNSSDSILEWIFQEG